MPVSRAIASRHAAGAIVCRAGLVEAADDAQMTRRYRSRLHGKRRGLLFRSARFVNRPPVPAGGTVKDQDMPKLILDEGNRALARGADEAGVLRCVGDARRTMPSGHSRSTRRIVVFRYDAPAQRPVLGLQLVAPTECAGPVIEDSRPERVIVEEPGDDRSVSARTKHRMRQQQAIGATHAPHDGRRVRHQLIGHGTQEARQIPGQKMPVLAETEQRSSWKAPNGQTKVRPEAARGTEADEYGLARRPQWEVPAAIDAPRFATTVRRPPFVWNAPHMLTTSTHVFDGGCRTDDDALASDESSDATSVANSVRHCLPRPRRRRTPSRVASQSLRVCRLRQRDQHGPPT